MNMCVHLGLQMFMSVFKQCPRAHLNAGKGFGCFIHSFFFYFGDEEISS